MPTPSKITVDFSAVEDRREGGGKAAHVPEGDYLLKPVGVTIEDNKEKTGKYLKWRMGIVEPARHKNAGIIYHNTTLKPEGLWSLRNLLEDMGLKVEKKALDIPLAAILKKAPIFGATLQDDEYNGKVKSTIAATFKRDAFEATDTADSEDTESEDTDEEEEEVDELDVDDL